MFGPAYKGWAANLANTHPRLAGAYLMALGGACFGVLFVVLRATGMAFFSFVPVFCVLFGGWMVAFGRPLSAAPAPRWQQAGVMGIVAISVLSAFTARTWLPLVIP